LLFFLTIMPVLGSADCSPRGKQGARHGGAFAIGNVGNGEWLKKALPDRRMGTLD
jgi:hypothetical protein